ncbi:MAG: chromate transporter [Oscillospiraceae bacterium]|nr:chromate transporter [Oscillospiraceae bacterium]
MAEKEFHSYGKLFFSTLKLSACTFGGGFVIIPLMKRRFVDELGWLEEDEMMDLTAIAQSSPGAIAVNASILVGYHMAGIPGALLTVLGTVLPPLAIISVISLFYQEFRDNAVVNMAMAGMLCGVAAVICSVVVDMTGSIVRQKRLLPLQVLAGAFIAVRFFSVNIMVIILVCGLIGAADTILRDRRRTVSGKQ